MRIRRRWRQVDVAVRARTSQNLISRVERGHAGSVSLDSLRRIAAAMDARLDVVPRWQGSDLDRLLNARHSAMHEAVAAMLGDTGGWAGAPEVSYAIFGQRGH